MKRIILSFILATICGIPAFAYDFSAVCESGQTLYYNITSDTVPYTVAVTRENTSSPYYTTYPTGELTIPSSVTYNSITYSVTSIGNYAFYGCSELTSLTIGNFIESIGSLAFKDCSGLTTVNYNATNCTTMGSSLSPVFYGCSSLTTLNIGNMVTNIPAYGFQNCSGLTSVTIPNSVTSIGITAFMNCSGLASITIPNSVTSIGRGAFNGCSGLVDITIPFVGGSATATTASESTLFGYIFGINSNTGSTMVRQYYGETYRNIDYYIPSALRSVTVTGGRLLYGSFYGCTMLTSVTIGDSITGIGSNAFNGCTGLTRVNYSGSIAQWCGITFGNNEANPLINAHNLYIDDSLVTDLLIPNTVTGINNYAFSGATCLTSITIPNSVTSIGNYAFNGCSGLSGTLTIPNSVASIGEYAFYGCSGLSGTLTIPNSVTSIGSFAFYGCSGLSGTLTIPNSVTSLDSNVFNGCSGLSGTLTIPNSVTSIGVGAFRGCSGLTEITIPNSVTSIGKGVFSGCSGLVEMTIPFVGGSATATQPSASTIFGYIFGSTSYTGGIAVTQFYSLHYTSTYYIPRMLRRVVVTGGDLFSGAFDHCSMLTSVTIGNSVASIGEYAFADCSGLTSVTISNSVTHIDSHAFDGCSGLTSVTIPNSVTQIGWSAFIGCSGLVDMTIPYVGANPSSIYPFGVLFSTSSGSDGTINQYVDGYTYVSANIPSCLRSVTITVGNTNNDTFVLKDYAFNRCTMLTSVTIPESVTSIGKRAFQGCSGLTDIYVNRTTPPTIVVDAWPSFDYYTATVWVPCGSAAAYRAADGWSNFNDIRERFPYALNVSSADLTMGTASVTQQPSCNAGIAIIAATPLRGYAFTQWNDGNTDNPRTVAVTADVEYTASFVALPAYTITAESADETRGTVSGGGTYYEGETATLNATANNGYAFTQWNDGNTDNPRTLTVTGDATYTATFVALHTITVTSADETQGTVSGGGTYLEDAEIEISATPVEHHHFTQWNDGNTDNPRTITITSDSTFTASFAIDRFTITVESNDIAMGTVSEGGTYDYGTEIQISATPAEGYGFATWNDGNTDNPRTIVVTEDITCTATFGAWRTITIVSADETQGTVEGTGEYIEGTTIQITAIPNEHYHFVHWIDEENPTRDFNTDNPRTIIVTGNMTYTAVFAIDQHTITVESADEAMGTASGSNSYDYGAEIQISATARDGYQFVSWNDGNTDNPRTITVTGDATYIATFAPNNYTIVVRSINEETGTVSGGGTFPYGTEIQISATPAENYAFVAWIDGNTDNPRTITVVADAEYTAAFTWVGAVEQTNFTEISLFPNPVTDILNITSSETISEIEIVNVMGQVVKRMEVNADNAVCDVEDLTSGVYVVRIHAAKSDTSTTLSVRRFVKE